MSDSLAGIDPASLKAGRDSLEKLLDVFALLTSTIELDPLLTKVLETAETLMEAEASNVMLMDRSKKELVYEVALGSAGQAIKEQKRLKLGVGIAGWVAEHGEGLLVEDAYKDPRFFRDFDLKTGFRTRSILCLPLKVKDDLIGIAQIINKRGAPHFTLADQKLFAKFCNIAAIAIDNALLHQKMIEQDRLERDMQLAEEIQKASIPERTPVTRDLRIEFRSVACRHVGGDVFDAAATPDGRIAVMVADVSGKGVPAALLGTRFSADYSHFRESETDGGRLFTRLNRAIAERATRGMFVTAVHASIDPRTGSVRLVNAGHLAPIIVGPATGQVRLIESTGFPPLGVLDDLELTTTEFVLQPGEHLLLMTDGVTEAKAHDGTRLGDARALAALSRDHSLSVSHLMNEVAAFTAGEALADDVTILGAGFGPYEERTYAADSAILPDVRAFLAEHVRVCGFTEKARDRAELALTEAVTNVIRHSYGVRPDRPAGPGEVFSLGIRAIPGEMELHLRDWGPKSDPTRFPIRNLDEIQAGGLGLVYMREVMDVVEFDTTHLTGNELHMILRNPGKGGRS